MIIVFDDMIVDMETNKDIKLIISNLLMKGRKLSNSVVFILKTYFKVSKDIRLNARHYLVVKILGSFQRLY